MLAKNLIFSPIYRENGPPKKCTKIWCDFCTFSPQIFFISPKKAKKAVSLLQQAQNVGSSWVLRYIYIDSFLGFFSIPSATLFSLACSSSKIALGLAFSELQKKHKDASGISTIANCVFFWFVGPSLSAPKSRYSLWVLPIPHKIAILWPQLSGVIRANRFARFASVKNASVSRFASRPFKGPHDCRCCF